MGIAYQEPRRVPSVDDCFFYHRMDLPDVGTVGTSWDLRNCVDQYLGECDFRGTRTLDVGTASGFLTFEMEKRGAEVVSFDMDSAKDWNLVPHHTFMDVWDARLRQRMESHRKLQNAYWFSHQRLDSRAQVIYGDIYDLPLELGNFNIVFMGMIVGHLRDPFQAIYSVSRLCRDKIIITNQYSKPRWWRRPNRHSGLAHFMPSSDNEVCDTWWSLSTECLERMLGTIGFRVIRKVKCSPKCLVPGRIGHERCVAIVAQRIAGRPLGMANGGPVGPTQRAA